MIDIELGRNRLSTDQLTKILHTADLHLDSPLKSLALKDERLCAQVQTASRMALQRMVQFSIDEGVSALLIAGDLFDSNERSAKTAAFLAKELDRLKAADIAVFYIKGNHDAENPVTGEITLPSNVHVFDGRGGKVQLPGTDIWIHGVSFRDKHAPKSLLPKYDPPVASAINIGMMHTSLSGAAGHDPYAPCTVAALQASNFDYWALGHVHRRQVHSAAPWIIMPGIPQGRDIGEPGSKSATLLKIDGSHIEVDEVHVSAVEFRMSNCNVTGIEDDDELRKLLRSHIREEATATTSDTAILRLILSGDTDRAWQIRRDHDVWETVIADLAAETNRIWIEQVSFEVAAPVSSGFDSDPVAELSSMMDEIMHAESFRAAARDELEQMIALLPAESRREVAPDEVSIDALIEQLTNDAALSMIARMKGVSA